MDAKKLITAAVAAFVIALVLGFVFHEFVMGSALRDAYPNMRDESQFGLLAAGTALLALLMAYMYPHGYKGGSPAVEGAKFGAMVGLLAWGPAQLILTAALDGWSLNTTVVIDILWHLVEEGAAGVAVGMVYGKG